jgi:hypothetical protein
LATVSQRKPTTAQAAQQATGPVMLTIMYLENLLNKSVLFGPSLKARPKARAQKIHQGKLSSTKRIILESSWTHLMLIGDSNHE